MTKEVALVLCSIFIILLFLREHRVRPLPSWELYIPFLWVVIIGSRPVSAWSEAEVDAEQLAASYIEGSPLDRNIFLVLIVAALYILWRRREEWGSVLASNRWLLLFLAYCGISALWSDFPYVSLKRWVKDIGSLLMVLVILSEERPFAALKSIFFRYICLAVPLSLLFIKYYPNIGRYYSHYSYEPAYCGVATNKNELGIILVICGMFLVQELMEVRDVPAEERERFDVAAPVLVLLLTGWLLHSAGSATAQVCLLLGSLLLVTLRFPNLRSQTRHLGAFSAAGVTVLILLYSIPSVTEGVVTMLGRDITFTGRTEIWKDVLSERINPWIGTGYRSFWLGPAMERLQLNQAHNGYLETYLNGGYLGLSLLLTVIAATGHRFAQTLEFDDDFAALRFSFFTVAVLYNWTEAMFNGLSLIWFMLLLAAVAWPEQETESLSAVGIAEGGEGSEV